MRVFIFDLLDILGISIQRVLFWNLQKFDQLEYNHCIVRFTKRSRTSPTVCCNMEACLRLEDEFTYLCGFQYWLPPSLRILRSGVLSLLFKEPRDLNTICSYISLSEWIHHRYRTYISERVGEVVRRNDEEVMKTEFMGVELRMLIGRMRANPERSYLT